MEASGSMAPDSPCQKSSGRQNAGNGICITQTQCPDTAIQTVATYEKQQPRKKAHGEHKKIK
jgi:hypothetical protein